MMQFIQNNEMALLTVCLLASEGLALIPGLKSNSILQLVINGLKSALDKLTAPKV